VSIVRGDLRAVDLGQQEHRVHVALLGRYARKLFKAGVIGSGQGDGR
jgi:hypothetical protein